MYNKYNPINVAINKIIMEATNSKVNYQAQLFLYDLTNKAKEHWFKPDESWEVSLVTPADKIVMEKKYFPTLSGKFASDIMLEIFNAVTSGLKQTQSAEELLLNTKNIGLNNLQYLIAINPNRIRT